MCYATDFIRENVLHFKCNGFYKGVTYISKGPKALLLMSLISVTSKVILAAYMS